MSNYKLATLVYEEEMEKFRDGIEWLPEEEAKLL